MATISQGLKDEIFFFCSLVKKPPGGYEKLLGRVKKYINVEKAQKARQTLKEWALKSNSARIPTNTTKIK